MDSELHPICHHHSISILHNTSTVNLGILSTRANNLFPMTRCTSLHHLLVMQSRANHIPANSSLGIRASKLNSDLPRQMDSNATRLSCGLYNSTGSYLHISTTRGGNSKPLGTSMARLMSHSDQLSILNHQNYRVLVTRSTAVDGNLLQSRRK